MTEKTLTTENIRPALDALRGELAPWPVVAKKQDRLNAAQLNAANSGITSSLVAQIIANTAAIRALESAITGTGLRALVVASLPAIGTQGILYIVPVTTYDPATDADVVNYSNEYLWIVAPDAPVTEGYYEQVGQTGIVINNGQLTITVNGTSVGTFTANQSGDTTAAITVPTNADYVDRTTDQTVAGVKTFSSTIDGTASKAIADEDGTSIKTGYVNVAGNQTVTGDKSFTGSNTFNNILPNATNSYSLGSSSYQWSSVYAQTYYYKGTAWGLDKANVWTGNNEYKSVLGLTGGEIWFKDPAIEDITSNPSSDISKSIFQFYNKTQTQYTGGIIERYLTDGTHQINISCLGFQLNNYGVYYAHSFYFEAKRDGTGSFFPSLNNVNLGTSTNQWKSVYSQTYYYNGTAWGLDIDNHWKRTQILHADTTIDIVNNPSNTIVGPALYWQDNNRFWAQYVPVWSTDGSFSIELGISNWTTAGNQGYWTVCTKISKDFGTFDFYTTHGAANLGTSTNKWKTLNGVNPGALSLPDVSKSVTVDIPVDWVTDGSAWNALNVSNMGDGWLCLTYRLCGAHDYILARLGGTNANTYPSMLFPATLLGDSKYYIFAFLPVTKAMGNIRLEINLTSGSVVVNHSFYPCLGNV